MRCQATRYASDGRRGMRCAGNGRDGGAGEDGGRRRRGARRGARERAYARAGRLDGQVRAVTADAALTCPPCAPPSSSPAAAASSARTSSSGSRPTGTSLRPAPRRLRPDRRRGRRAALRRRAARARHPPRRRGRRHRREPRQPRPLLVREPDHGRAGDRAERARRRREVRRSPARSAPTRSSRRCRFARTISGTATPRRRTRRTGSPRRCCSSAPGIPRAVRPQRDLPPAGQPLRPARQLRPRELARDPGADPQDGRGAGARRAEVVLWGDGSPTREFLYVDDCAEGDPARGRALRRRRAGEPRRRARRSRSGISPSSSPS